MKIVDLFPLYFLNRTIRRGHNHIHRKHVIISDPDMWGLQYGENSVITDDYEIENR